MNEKSRVDTTSAEDKSIGFDYQYYFFLNALLNLKTGQVVGLEVLDDVYIELADGTQLLVQLKHTIQTNAAGLPKNLTTMDSDLWKSLSNWSRVVVDPAEGRGNLPAQLAFIKKTGFVLASNKSEGHTNLLLSSVFEFKAGNISHAGLLADTISPRQVRRVRATFCSASQFSTSNVILPLPSNMMICDGISRLPLKKRNSSRSCG